MLMLIMTEDNLNKISRTTSPRKPKSRNTKEGRREREEPIKDLKEEWLSTNTRRSTLTGELWTERTEKIELLQEEPTDTQATRSIDDLPAIL